jgi:hypothetical protein
MSAVLRTARETACLRDRNSIPGTCQTDRNAGREFSAQRAFDRGSVRAPGVAREETPSELASTRFLTEQKQRLDAQPFPFLHELTARKRHVERIELGQDSASVARAQ